MKNTKIAGSWNYSDSMTPHQYGEIESYKLAANWLNACSEVEDRGCGCAFARQFFTTKYTGLDGSPSKWTDKVVDLLVYKNKVAGILMRHVLEHNDDWRVVLQNALDSFTHRMVLILHIQPSPNDFYLNPAVFPGGIEVPNIAICEADLMARISEFVTKKEIVAVTGEIVYYLEKRKQ